MELLRTEKTWPGHAGFPEFPGSEMAGFIYGCIDTYKDQ